MAADRDLIKNIAFIVASFVIAGVVLWWLRYDIQVQSEKALSLRHELGADADLAVSFAALKNQAEKAEVFERRLAGLLPVSDKLIDFRGFLEVLGNQRGVTTDFSFEGAGVAGDEGKPSAIGFSLEMSGPLSGIQGLLNDIEVNPRSYLLSFDAFDLSKKEGEYRVIFRGKLYYQETVNS